MIFAFTIPKEIIFGIISGMASAIIVLDTNQDLDLEKFMRFKLKYLQRIKIRIIINKDPQQLKLLKI